jgi:hypothetical protein
MLGGNQRSDGSEMNITAKDPVLQRTVAAFLWGRASSYELRQAMEAEKQLLLGKHLKHSKLSR